MRRLLLLSLAWSCSWLALAAPSGAIVGGRPVAPGTYPFLVNVGGGCGGTLVAPDRVLTAAHCVSPVTPRLTVAVGDVRIGSSPRRVQVADIARSPSFSTTGLITGDVAVLRLAEPVMGVEPVRLATPADAGRWAPGAPLRVVGWGVQQVGGTARDPRFGPPELDLRDADLAAADDAACARYYARAPVDPVRIDRSNLVCAAGPDGAALYVAACVGDSGGPLLARDDDGAWLQVGIFSFMQRCGADADPQAFTEVAAARAFVDDPDPVWAPMPVRLASISGRARVGGTLRCRAPRWTHPPDELFFAWAVGGGDFGRPVRSAAHRVVRSEAGRRLMCRAVGVNAGGFSESGGRPVRVAGARRG